MLYEGISQIIFTIYSIFFPSALFFIILFDAGKQIGNPLGFKEALRAASTSVPWQD